MNTRVYQRWLFYIEYMTHMTHMTDSDSHLVEISRILRFTEIQSFCFIIIYHSIS